jgi:hypothetical protein
MAEIFVELGDDSEKLGYPWMARIHPAHSEMVSAYVDYKSKAQTALAVYDVRAAEASCPEPSE